MNDTGTAITYSRVSGEEQAKKGYSLPDQREGTRRWCEEEGYEILEEIADPGHSGGFLERPGLDRLRDLVAAGGISVVVAQDRDRFAREPGYVFLLEKEFAEHGTRLVALNARGDGSPEGELTDGVLDQLAKFERAKIAERTRRGLKRKVAEGKLIRNWKPPYGFRYDQDGEGLVVIESEMVVVREIFRMIGLEGVTLGEVVRRLHSAGYPAPAGELWLRSTLGYLMKNDVYKPHTVDEVAASALVSPEVVRPLDPERLYGLWTYNARRRTTSRERGEDGEYRTRYHVAPRPRSEWSAVPVDLTDAGIVRAHVDAARERLSDNTRRSPSTVATRFWQLSGGIAQCAVCGGALSPHTVKRSEERRDGYYRCGRRYNKGPHRCTNAVTMRAATFEEAVWQAVFSIMRNPERLKRQHQEHIDRQIRQLRGNPNREMRALVQRLQKLERRRSGYLDLAADGDMSREDLRTKLATVDAQRDELQKALREAQGRHQTIKQLEFQRDHNLHFVEALGDAKYVTASPQDRRRIYQALRLQAKVDKEGQIVLSGIFSPDVHLHEMLKDPPVDPSKPVPKVPEGTTVQVVTLDNTPAGAGWRR